MGELSRRELFRGNCLEGKSPEDNCPGGNFIGVGQLFGGKLFRREVSWNQIYLVPYNKNILL